MYIVPVYRHFDVVESSSSTLQPASLPAFMYVCAFLHVRHPDLLLHLIWPQKWLNMAIRCHRKHTNTNKDTCRKVHVSVCLCDSERKWMLGAWLWMSQRNSAPATWSGVAAGACLSSHQPVTVTIRTELCPLLVSAPATSMSCQSKPAAGVCVCLCFREAAEWPWQSVP